MGIIKLTIYNKDHKPTGDYTYLPDLAQLVTAQLVTAQANNAACPHCGRSPLQANTQAAELPAEEIEAWRQGPSRPEPLGPEPWAKELGLTGLEREQWAKHYDGPSNAPSWTKPEGPK